MNVASLSREELFDAFWEITVKICTNDHEEGVDGKWKNVRQKVCSCLDADWGKNNACAHCGTVHFPLFPAHDIVERVLEIICVTDEVKKTLSYGYAASSHLIIGLDRVRVMSVRYHPNASREVMDHLREIKKLYDVWPYIKIRWEQLFYLHQMAQEIFLEWLESSISARQKKFMTEFKKEKIIVTEFRKKIINEIGKYVPQPKNRKT